MHANNNIQSAVYNSALRQSKAIRADLSAFASSPSSSSNAALQGQLTTSLAAFSRTLDDYQRNVDNELVPDKAEKGKERIAKFREDLLEFRAQFAELKHERDQAVLAGQRGELMGRRGYVRGAGEGGGEGEGGGGGAAEGNPYSDAAVNAGGGGGQHANPLFRTSNPNFVPNASGAPNSYSAYQSPYGAGMGSDSARADHALREQSFFASSNATLDEYLERGRAVLGDLGDQREVLKNTQRKLYSVGTTLGISGDTIRMVERRAKQDKWIFWGGVVGFILFVYLVLRFLR